MAEPRPRVFEPVHDRLRGDILAGRLQPGESVPSERALAEEYGVGRHAVREALKRLEQAGLVRISQGGATRVLDWRDSGGLEVLLDLLEGSRAMPPLRPRDTGDLLALGEAIADGDAEAAARAAGQLLEPDVDALG